MINNVYKLATQLEIIRYMHTMAGFPTKAMWIKSNMSRKLCNMPEIMIKVVQKHFLESKEMKKEHARKMKVGLQTTKVKVNEEGEPVERAGDDSNRAKRKEIFMKLVDMEEELHNKIFTD